MAAIANKNTGTLTKQDLTDSIHSSAAEIVDNMTEKFNEFLRPLDKLNKIEYSLQKVADYTMELSLLAQDEPITARWALGKGKDPSA